MGNQGDGLGNIATLDRENPFECVSGECVGADSIERFGRIDDWIAGAQGFNCPCERGGVDLCLRQSGFYDFRQLMMPFFAVPTFVKLLSRPPIERPGANVAPVVHPVEVNH